MLKANMAAVDALANPSLPALCRTAQLRPHPRGCCSPYILDALQCRRTPISLSAQTAPNTQNCNANVTIAQMQVGPNFAASIRLFVTPEHRQVSLPFMGIPQTIQFASLGMADSLILMVLALVVFGPRRLPQIGRQIGKLMYEFRKASNDFKFQMEEELRNAEEADRRNKEEERLRTLALAAPPQSAGTDAESQVSEVSAGAPQTGPEIGRASGRERG